VDSTDNTLSRILLVVVAVPVAAFIAYLLFDLIRSWGRRRR
jgi:hypothetical protein